MRRLLLILATSLILLLVAPATVKADGVCGILCQWVGWDGGFSERAKIKADRDERLAEIERQRQTDVAAAKAASDLNIENAKIQLERERQAGLISVAEEQRKGAEYTALINAATNKAIADINGQYALMIANQQEVTKIAIAGIKDTGLTERTKVMWDGKYNIVTVLVISLIVAGWMHYQDRKRQMEITALRPPALPPPYYIQLPDGYTVVQQPGPHEQAFQPPAERPYHTVEGNGYTVRRYK
jgi:hypothetical protein